jgi:hypothetical protein
MDARTTANLYYDAWLHRAGDMTGVPLAEDFAFSGPVASFDTAEGFRAMAREAGAAVRSFRVRHQFADGDLVCSVIDWEMAMLPGVLTAAELLEVRDGRIVRGELIYDAEELRRAMAGPTIVELLERSFRDTADMLERVDETGWTAPSRCSRWTVRQAGNHLVGGIAVLTKIVNEEPIDPDEVDAQKTADTDHLGSDPATVPRGGPAVRRSVRPSGHARSEVRAASSGHARTDGGQHLPGRITGPRLGHRQRSRRDLQAGRRRRGRRPGLGVHDDRRRPAR